MVTIHRGDEQPIPCNVCDDYCGYTISDTIKIQYTIEYGPNGSMDGGSYGDSEKILNRGKTPYCANCHRRLNFRVVD